MRGKDRNNDSLCKNSMKMVANIVKLSSFSIAKRSLGATEPSVTKNLASVTESAVDGHVPLLPQIPGSQKAQKIRSRLRPFVMQPDDENGSMYVIQEENSVIDGMASEYIRKFHEKNSYEANIQETSELSPYRPSFPSWAVK